jgi:shikimate kinase
VGAANSIFLVGFMGTGKTQVGREVASLLGWELVDTDAEIESRAGKPIRQIFAEDGEPAFRLLEKQVLQEVCSAINSPNNKVVSSGGGMMADPQNRELMLSSGLVVCLDALPETIYSRLLGDSSNLNANPQSNPLQERPLLSGPDPLGRIKEIKDSRRAHYMKAHCTISTDNLTVAQAAQEVVRMWQSVKDDSGGSLNAG